MGSVSVIIASFSLAVFLFTLSACFFTALFGRMVRVTKGLDELTRGNDV
jgi:hypothetical protein